MAPPRYYAIETRWRVKRTDLGEDKRSSAAREKLPLTTANEGDVNLYDRLDETLDMAMKRVKRFYQERVDDHYFDGDESWVYFTQDLAREFKQWDKDLGDRGRDAIGYCNMYKFVTIDKAIEEENTASKEGNMKIVLEYQVGKKAKNSEGNLDCKYHHKLTWEFKLERLPIPVHVSSRRSGESDDESANGSQDRESEQTDDKQSSEQTDGKQSSRAPTATLEERGDGGEGNSFRSSVMTTGTSNF